MSVCEHTAAFQFELACGLAENKGVSTGCALHIVLHWGQLYSVP